MRFFVFAAIAGVLGACSSSGGSGGSQPRDMGAAGSMDDLAGADLAGADLAGADLASADLTSTDLAGADLLGIDLAVVPTVDLAPAPDLTSIEPPNCSNNIAESSESDVDCGDDTNQCRRCAIGKKCTSDSSCASRSCAMTSTPNCADGELRFYYSFDGADPPLNVTDESGRMIAGVDGSDRAVGKRGLAASFTVNGSLAFYDHPDLNPTSMTASVWVTLEQSGFYKSILMKTNDESWNTGYGLYLDGDQTQLCAYVGVFTSKVCAAFPLTTTFRHVAFTYDAANTTLKLYFDGVLQGERSDILASPSTGQLKVAQVPGGYNWVGKIDELYLFGRALSATEIAALTALP